MHDDASGFCGDTRTAKCEDFFFAGFLTHKRIHFCGAWYKIKSCREVQLTFSLGFDDVKHMYFGYHLGPQKSTCCVRFVCCWNGRTTFVCSNPLSTSTARPGKPTATSGHLSTVAALGLVGRRKKAVGCLFTS